MTQSIPQTLPDSREAFEAWWRARDPISCDLEKRDNGSYLYGPTQTAWQAWQAALSQPMAVAAIPEGMALVPIEPTPDSIRAGRKLYGDAIGILELQRLYCAMVAAAPQPPAVQQDRGEELSCQTCGRVEAHYHSTGADGALKTSVLPRVAQIWREQGLGVTAFPQSSFVAQILRDSAPKPTALAQPLASNWVWTHTKSGGEYTLLGNAKIQSTRALSDMAEVYVYQGEDHKMWVRPIVEFNERFKRTRPLAGSSGVDAPTQGAAAAGPWIDPEIEPPPRDTVVLIECKPGCFADYMPQVQTASSEWLYFGGKGQYTRWARINLPPVSAPGAVEGGER